MTPLPNTANRLALGLMAARGIFYEEAVLELERLTLQLVCDSRISNSASLQAAFITAANCGKRAFLGGLQIEMPENVPLLLPWPSQTTLNGVVEELTNGAASPAAPTTQTVYFGFSPIHPEKHSLTVNATGWRGGVEPSSATSRFDASADSDFPLGGVFAGGLAVHRGFLRATALSILACDECAGISLWDQGADWLSSSSEGPPLRALPANLWLLGLGHLGQAFLWTLGLLPFKDPSKLEAMLQDYDGIEEANVGSGLLCSAHDIGQHKARVCARWLEARGFRTKICERAFGEHTRREANEPSIALCGFDRPEPRRLLEGAGFARVIECGLGGSVHDFDLIHIHNFPGHRAAAEIWQQSGTQAGRANPRLVEALTPAGEKCGALAIEVAGKSVSTSFVGAMASAAVFGELIRAFHKGDRHDEIYLSPRSMTDSDFVRSIEFYNSAEMAALGFADPVAKSAGASLPD